MKIKLVNNLYLRLLNLVILTGEKGCCVFKLDVKTHAVYSQEAQILRVYTLAASCQIYPSDIFYLICTVFKYQLATTIKTKKVHYIKYSNFSSDFFSVHFHMSVIQIWMVASSGSGGMFPPAMIFTTPYYSKSYWRHGNWEWYFLPTSIISVIWRPLEFHWICGLGSAIHIYFIPSSPHQRSEATNYDVRRDDATKVSISHCKTGSIPQPSAQHAVDAKWYSFD